MTTHQTSAYDDTMHSLGAASEALEYGFVVVIRRNGKDGASFPVMEETTIGRSTDCQMWVEEVPTVSHSAIKISPPPSPPPFEPQPHPAADSVSVSG